MKNILDNIDLYGFDLLLTAMKKDFIFISFSKNSVPTHGSLTIPTSDLTKFADDTKILKTIFHKNGNITIQTNKSYFKLSN